MQMSKALIESDKRCQNDTPLAYLYFAIAPIFKTIETSIWFHIGIMKIAWANVQCRRFQNQYD
jgi:hypothetical protein